MSLQVARAKASSSVHKPTSFELWINGAPPTSPSTVTSTMDKRHYPKLNNYASSGFGFLKKLAMDGWFAGAAGPFFATSFGL